MAADAPLSRLVLAAASVADDIGYAALADLSRVLSDVTEDYRIIGGHMVTMLAARWRLSTKLYRETGDVDLGVPPVIARDEGLAGRLRDLGYKQVAGNRFARSIPDIPSGLIGKGNTRLPEALIDVLVPTYTSRARENVEISDDLFTTEVPGLSIALARAPVKLALELHRLSGKPQQVEMLFPDEVSALVLKSLATRVRHKDTDVTDVWRCLEIAFAAGVCPDDFSGGVKAEGAARIRDLFRSRRSPGMAALAAGLGLPDGAADEYFTRIRALINRTIGPERGPFPPGRAYP